MFYHEQRNQQKVTFVFTQKVLFSLFLCHETPLQATHTPFIQLSRLPAWNRYWFYNCKPYNHIQTLVIKYSVTKNPRWIYNLVARTVPVFIYERLLCCTLPLLNHINDIYYRATNKTEIIKISEIYWKFCVESPVPFTFSHADSVRTTRMKMLLLVWWNIMKIEQIRNTLSFWFTNNKTRAKNKSISITN